MRRPALGDGGSKGIQYSVRGTRLARDCSGSLMQYGLGFALGIGAFQLLPEIPSVAYLTLTLAAFLLLSFFWCPARLLLSVAVGFCWAYLHACWGLCDPLTTDFEGKDIWVQGQVLDLPQVNETGVRLLFRVEKALGHPEPASFSGRVRLSWYGEVPDLSVGELWELRVRLRPPHGLANPGGFDYERWLFQQGIKAVGTVGANAANRRLDPGPGGLWLGRLRQRLSEHLGEVLGDRPEVGLVQALVVGDRNGIPAATWESLTRTGTNHLVAISGLHVGIVAGIFFFVTQSLWRLQESLCRWVAAPRAAAVGAFAGAFCYSALAGFAVSTQRALIMLSVVLGARWFACNLRPTTGLIAALVGVLAFDPLAVLSYGFWLSFAAVAALVYSMVRLEGRPGLWWRWGRAQWVVALGLLPLLLLLFGRAATAAPLVNLVAVPLFSLLILPFLLFAAFLSFVPGGGWALQATASALGWLASGLDWIAAQPWSIASVASRPWWTWVLAFTSVVLLLAPRGLPGRWLGAVLILPLLLVTPPRPAAGELWFTLLDVGQGLSAVLRTEKHLLVYDLGSGASPVFNAGSSAVRPFLQQEGQDRVDLLVLSHADKDHVGGLPGLLVALLIDRVLSGEPDKLSGIPAEACTAGQGWEWDGVRFLVLSPPPEQVNRGNDSSCVIRVENAAGSLLLTGDIGRSAELQLIREAPDRLPNTILIAAHHGSAGSSSGAFLERVRARYVLVSAGYGNRFGFPKREVMERARALEATVLNTATAGAISLRLSPGEGVSEPDLYRLTERRYWRHGAGGFGR